MMCMVSVRRIRSGAYEGFRRAWEPDPWPERLVRLSLSRNAEDPDEVCSIGYFDMTADEMEAMRDDPAVLVAESERLQRIAPFQETVLVNAVYEVAEELTAPSVR
jgi:hypothetical protein